MSGLRLASRSLWGAGGHWKTTSRNGSETSFLTEWPTIMGPKLFACAKAVELEETLTPTSASTRAVATRPQPNRMRTLKKAELDVEDFFIGYFAALVCLFVRRHRIGSLAQSG